MKGSGITFGSKDNFKVFNRRHLLTASMLDVERQPLICRLSRLPLHALAIAARGALGTSRSVRALNAGAAPTCESGASAAPASIGAPQFRPGRQPPRHSSERLAQCASSARSTPE